MEPIAKRLKQSAEYAVPREKNFIEKEDIAARIEQLEAELHESDNDSSDSRSESEFENGKTKAVVNLSAYASERIKALPQNMLPAVSLSSSLTPCKQMRLKMEQKNQTAEKNLEELRDAISFPSKVPFACKACKYIGQDLATFQAHRASKEHLERLQIGDKALHCSRCKKSFTSLTQLDEHRAGKWHKQRAHQKKERHTLKVCYDFIRGECKWGDRCNFEHTTTQAMRSGRALDKYRKRICDSFASTKSCRYGEKCLFLHNRKIDTL